MKRLAIKDIEWSIECLPEDIPIKGNAIASGNDTYDREVENRIADELLWNEWAWCCVKVTGNFNGISANTYLGACSYDSEESFKAGGYYVDMQAEVLDDIQAQIESLIKAVS